jgi:hypothetical protein
VTTLYGPGGQALSRASRWFTPDSRGSTSRITHSLGNVVQAYGYGVFGPVTQSTGESNPIQFLGGMNEHNGLHYLGGGNGYFSPTIGQSLGGGKALSAHSVLRPIGDFLGGVGHCLGNAARSLVHTGYLATHPEAAIEEGVAIAQSFARDVQNKGSALAVLDPITDTLQQFGDFSSARAAGNSLCNDALLGLSVADSGPFTTVKKPSPMDIGAPAEAAFRDWLEEKDVVLAPKSAPSANGPDAVRVGGTDLGWQFAELKPNTHEGIEAGWEQVRRRFDQGYSGPGALYVYDGSPGNYLFQLIGILKEKDPTLF